MRISDWSSDVCSSDRVLAWLILFASSVAWVFIQGFQSRNGNNGNYGLEACSSFAMGISQVYVLSKVISSAPIIHTLVYCTGRALGIVQIRRAPGRERGCQYAKISVVAVSL